MSSLTRITIGTLALVAGTFKVSPEQLSGQELKVFAGDVQIARTKFDAHLYGPGRNVPDSARIADGVSTLPPAPPIGDYTFKVRKLGERDPIVITLLVRAAARTDAASASTAFGVCIDREAVPGLASKLAALGVTHVRVFCPSIGESGVPSLGYLDLIRQSRKASPALKWVCLHGVAEQSEDDDGKVTRRATPVSETARAHWHAATAKAFAEFGDGVVLELNNEVNLQRYLYFGQQENRVDPRVVQYVLRECQIAFASRKAVGGTYKIISPTIGYTDSPAVHKAYHDAFKAAGVFDYVDIAGVHCYTRKGAQEFDDYVGHLRELIGPIMPIYGTEWGAQYQTTSDGATNLAAYKEVADKYGATMFLYRAAPGTKRRASDSVSLLNADLTVNTPIAKALGLAVTA